jgi:hypothetical protein
MHIDPEEKPRAQEELRTEVNHLLSSGFSRKQIQKVFEEAKVNPLPYLPPPPEPPAPPQEEEKQKKGVSKPETDLVKLFSKRRRR